MIGTQWGLSARVSLRERRQCRDFAEAVNPLWGCVAVCTVAAITGRTSYRLRHVLGGLLQVRKPCLVR